MQRNQEGYFKVSLITPNSMLTARMQKRHLLNQPLKIEEIETLKKMSKYHRFGDFRLRALGLLALNDGQRVVDIQGPEGAGHEFQADPVVFKKSVMSQNSPD